MPSALDDDKLSTHEQKCVDLSLMLSVCSRCHLAYWVVPLIIHDVLRIKSSARFDNLTILRLHTVDPPVAQPARSGASTAVAEGSSCGAVATIHCVPVFPLMRSEWAEISGFDNGRGYGGASLTLRLCVSQFIRCSLTVKGEFALDGATPGHVLGVEQRWRAGICQIVDLPNSSITL